MAAEDPINLKFDNNQKPRAQFDILSIQDILQREHEDHSPFELHTVDFYLIILIEKGTGIHTIDFTEYSYSANSLITIRKNQLHKFHPNDSVKGTVLLFTDLFLISYLEKLEGQKSMQLFNEIVVDAKVQLSKGVMRELSDLIARIKKEYFKVYDEYSLGIIRSELQILIAKLFRVKSRGNGLLENRKYLSRFIEFQELVESNARSFTKVKDYAKMMGLTPKTLSSTTRSIINRTAKQFVDDICTQQIKRLLINTEYSIKEVAIESGFEETTNFYKYFKRQTQITPEQFRERFR